MSTCLCVQKDGRIFLSLELDILNGPKVLALRFSVILVTFYHQQEDTGRKEMNLGLRPCPNQQHEICPSTLNAKIQLSTITANV